MRLSSELEKVIKQPRVTQKLFGGPAEATTSSKNDSVEVQGSSIREMKKIRIKPARLKSAVNSKEHGERRALSYKSEDIGKRGKMFSVE